ncbi:penicillin-binding protein 1F [Oceanobacillus oncorhynchi subsp. incaldanensis]|uniref:Penicillin-binding protein 1F n=2 Tax=Oceanobacillus TaxID=182709 RepID=A0A0A1MLU3_9BACI|nr:PBP1A family penicillin-binding protein [Oceanobacillus oncorhynchi]MDM8102722.1 PBP1A family penicillin-binding protein [Oceanobacillus oncorhynchi]GIO16902.1 penicillin-binding protein 1F [Oceanobacillus oncorhynchi subsp. incaldanensis]CEI84043.1 Penicillin-binding protein 1F [Oceanobacillus oncorhynchi]
MRSERRNEKRNERKKQQKNVFRQKIKWLGIAVAAVFLLLLSGYGLLILGGKMIANEEDLQLDLTTTIRTENGEVIRTLYNENREYVSTDHIPDHVLEAFVAVEDRRFYEHQGIDLQSISRAVYRDILARSKVEGGSTITQQLSKNLFLSNDKSWTRKIKEMMASLYLERRLSKDEILELYVNQVYFGEGVYGLQKASEYFFSKDVDELTISEGALLAGLMKAPNGYSPLNHPDKAAERRNVVLMTMESAGFIDEETMAAEQEKGLGINLKEEERGTNPWVDSYVDIAIKEAAEAHDLSFAELQSGGYDITVYMNEDFQQVAYQNFQEDAFFPGNTEGTEGAFVMLDKNNGHIVSAIGGRDYSFGDLNRTNVQRQPGSTFKPVAVYGPALMQEDEYNPYTIIPDQYMDIDGYEATNVSGEYKNNITIYQAIVESTNTSAVWLLNEIGIDNSKSYLEKMGMPIEDKGLSIALGGLNKGVTPLQMAQSFQTFANNGEMSKATAIAEIKDRNGEIIYQSESSSEEVFTPQVAWDMTEMLKETVRTGTASSGYYGKELAGKTGTTQHPAVDGASKDAWFVGYTPDYVTAMWMGYDRSDAEHYLTGGSSYPTSLTKKILTDIDNQTGSGLTASFEMPEGVEALPEPIDLPVIEHVDASYTFGGFALLKGKLSWEGSTDDRVVYRIYKEEEGTDELVGEVEGETEFIVDDVWFRNETYYVVPVDPITNMEGSHSTSVSFF